MGRRKISLDPAARVLGAFGLSVMKVSLCGPHSFETSTLAPTISELVTTGEEFTAPPVTSCWYLFHQVGLLGLLVWAPVPIANATTVMQMDAVRSRVRKGNLL